MSPTTAGGGQGFGLHLIQQLINQTDWSEFDRPTAELLGTTRIGPVYVAVADRIRRPREGEAMKPTNVGRLLTIPVLAAGIATAVFVYTSVHAPAPQAPAPAAATELATTNGMTVSIDQSKLSILPDWLRNCLDPNTKQEGEAGAQKSDNPLDPSNWPQLPNPLDPNSWQLPCPDLSNPQVPDWLDPNNIADSVQQHIDPQDWGQAQHLLQELEQVPAHPDTFVQALKDAWAAISKNPWLLVIALVVIGVLVIHVVASGAKSKGKGQYTFDQSQNDSQNPGNHVGKHIGIKEQKLCDRINDGSNASVNSTFKDAASARRFIQTTIDKNRPQIDKWLASAPDGARRSYKWRFNETTGEGVDLADCPAKGGAPDPANVRSMRGVRVILEADPAIPHGFSVFNAFPED
jgi:hypothetical protein